MLFFESSGDRQEALNWLAIYRTALFNPPLPAALAFLQTFLFCGSRTYDRDV